MKWFSLVEEVSFILPKSRASDLGNTKGVTLLLWSESMALLDHKGFAWKLLQKWGAKSLEASREWGALSGRSEKADQGIEMAFT